MCHFQIQKQSKKLAVEFIHLILVLSFFFDSWKKSNLFNLGFSPKTSMRITAHKEAHAWRSTGVRSSGVRISRGHGPIYEENFYCVAHQNWKFHILTAKYVTLNEYLSRLISSHFSFLVFDHFWRQSYKNMKILLNLCSDFARQDGQDGKKRK